MFRVVIERLSRGFSEKRVGVELGAGSESLGAPEDWRVSAHYRVGAVQYYLYSDDNGASRLRFIEPPSPSVERLKDLVAGIAKPSSEAERYHVEKSLSGYGPLYPLIIDGNIEEIALEGYHSSVSVIHRLVPARWVDVDLKLDPATVDSLVLQLSRKSGRIVSLLAPYAEGLTGEGYRVAVTFMREVSRFGSSFVVRKYPEKPATIADMIAARTLSPSWLRTFGSLLKRRHSC